jgi:serine protease Do
MDEAMRVSEQLRASGRVTRGRIGVQIDQVTKEVAESLGLPKPLGALVRGVEVGAPAEKGGVEAGDIITKFEGRVVEKSSDLPRMVGATKPGTRSTLTVFRRGAYKELTVTIAEIEADKPVKKASEKEVKPKASSAGQAIGLAVSELTDAQKKELKVKGGVKVDAATEAAARAGLQEGDVIVQIGNLEVANVKEFEAAVTKSEKNKVLTVLFRRGEWAQYAVIKLAK